MQFRYRFTETKRHIARPQLFASTTHANLLLPIWDIDGFPRPCLHISCTRSWIIYSKAGHLHRYNFNDSRIEVMILKLFTRRLNPPSTFSSDCSAKQRDTAGYKYSYRVCPLRVHKVKIFNAFRKTLITYAAGISVIQISWWCDDVTFPNNLLLCRIGRASFVESHLVILKVLIDSRNISDIYICYFLASLWMLEVNSRIANYTLWFIIIYF